MSDRGQGGYGDQPAYGPPPGWAGPPSAGPPNYGQPGFGQPPGYGGGYGYYPPAPPPGLKPSDNIGWAIAAIFLFWPLCIPAFIFSSRVDSAWFVGGYYGAQKASADAKKFGLIGVIVGGSLIALYILFIVILLVAVGTS